MLLFIPIADDRVLPVRDVLKIWLYAALALMTGAWITPVVYNAGKALAEVSEVKQTNGILERLANGCRVMQFPDFYELAIALAAAFWFMWFFAWLRIGQEAPTGRGPWKLRLPEGVQFFEKGQRLRKNRMGSLQAASGFLLMTGFLVILGCALLEAGSFTWMRPGKGWLQTTAWALAAAWVLAILKELLFRGIALGIFLRAMPPGVAILLSALLYAGVHFLLPIGGLTVADPDVKGVGFELLAKLAMRFGDWHALVSDFSVLFAMGLLLAHARWRTASLWLPIGLQAGWIFAEWIFGRFTVAVERPDLAARLLSGQSIQQGLIPLVGVIFTSMLIYFFTDTGKGAASETH